MSRSAVTAPPLEAQALAEALDRLVCGRVVGSVDVLDEIDSTNEWLMERASEAQWHGSVCTARVQRAGRGRRGRVWESRADDDVPLSVAWRFTSPGVNCNGLSLGVGVALAQVAERLGAHGVGIKWPNDIVFDGRKLAGVLIQTTVAQGAVTGVVTGVGVNVSALNHPERVGLEEIGAVESGIDRNELAAELARALLDLLEKWEQRGLDGVRKEYARFDLLEGKAITVTRPHDVLTGVAEGIDSSGALLLRAANGEAHQIHAGDATLGGYGAAS